MIAAQTAALLERIRGAVDRLGALLGGRAGDRRRSGQAGAERRHAGADYHPLRPAAIVRQLLDRPPPAHDPGRDPLSFLGLGLRSPALSHGVLLPRAENSRSVAIYPWLPFQPRS